MTNPFNTIEKLAQEAIDRKYNLSVIEDCVKDLVAEEVRFGKSVKTCSYRRHLSQSFEALTVSPKTAANYITAIVAAVNDGVPFSLSSSKRSIRRNAQGLE
jgi:hypothetical protein